MLVVFALFSFSFVFIFFFYFGATFSHGDCLGANGYDISAQEDKIHKTEKAPSYTRAPSRRHRCGHGAHTVDDAFAAVVARCGA